MKNNNSKLFKWILALVVITVLCGSISQWAFKKTLEQDPDIVGKIEAALRKHFETENIHLDFNGSRETEDQVLQLDLPLNQLNVKTTTGSIEVVRSPNASQVVISSRGFKRRSTSKPESSADNLSFGSADVTIELPGSYTGPVLLKTVSGDITINELESERLEAVSVSGKVELKNISNKKTVIHSVSSDIEIEQKSAGELNINSISGNVSVHLVDPKEGYLFDVKSVSGEVTNSHEKQTAGKTPVVVTTTSGDIQIY